MINQALDPTCFYDDAGGVDSFIYKVFSCNLGAPV
jgi:hypothetical protein